MLNQQDLYEKVCELMDHVDDMRENEHQFIMGLADYEEQGRMLTQPQADWVEDLYRRWC